MARQEKAEASASLLKRLGVSALSLAWLAFVFRNSLKSKAASAAQSSSLVGLLERMLKLLGIDSVNNAVVFVRKCAHVFEFFVLAMLIYFLFRVFGASFKSSLIASTAVAFLCACTDELLQILSQRGPAVSDVLIDCIGIALFACLALIINKKIKHLQ